MAFKSHLWYIFNYNSLIHFLPVAYASFVIWQDEFSALVQAWNAQRSLALERALTKSLFPQLEKELKLSLLVEAKEGIMRVS